LPPSSSDDGPREIIRREKVLLEVGAWLKVYQQRSTRRSRRRKRRRPFPMAGCTHCRMCKGSKGRERITTPRHEEACGNGDCHPRRGCHPFPDAAPFLEDPQPAREQGSRRDSFSTMPPPAANDTCSPAHVLCPRQCISFPRRSGS